MATKTTDMGVYVPKDGGFVGDVNGSPVNFHSNIRVSRAWLDEHPEWEDLFEPIKLNYDVEPRDVPRGVTR